MTYVRAAAALALSAAGLWWVLHGMDPAQLRDAWRGTEGLPWFLLVPAAVGVEFAARSWRWGVLLSPLRLGKGRLFAVTSAGFFVNSVLPFRAGEAARLYWTCRDSGASPAFGAAVLVVDRLFDVLVIAALFVFVLLRWNAFPGSRAAAAVLGAGALLGCLCLWALARWPEKASAAAGRAGLPERPRAWLVDFARGSGALARPSAFAGLFLLSLSFWAMNAVLFSWLSRVFGLGLSLTEGAALLLSFCAGAAVPSAPGYVGTLEAAGAALLAAAGRPRAESLSFILTLHAASILSTALYGAPGLFFLGKDRAHAS